ncbi:diacylglycerol kinase [Legionella cardiaca]|uniref:Diacylglycerol kinase n=1 Tax=Legionella cardiaca TaxID=1071983 RepID=A0ABY8ATR8_9GAMM|nr:diacylglycerol kinase [Legionella cardiaca]WED42756.1 diacylglycerol kinase [Legionella cardiaca]
MIKFLAKAVIHIKKASVYSSHGLQVAFKEELAFRLEILCLMVALPTAILLGHSALERVALISSVLLVPIMELLNSAIEITLDRIDLAWHPLTKKAKDMGSAAILLAVVNAVIVWSIIIVSYF